MMAFSPEMIDNWLPCFPRGGYERFVKKQTHKYRRRKVKEYLRVFSEDVPEPNDKYFSGWTT